VAVAEAVIDEDSVFADIDADKVDAMLEERAGLTLVIGEVVWPEQSASSAKST